MFIVIGDKANDGFASGGDGAESLNGFISDRSDMREIGKLVDRRPDRVDDISRDRAARNSEINSSIKSKSSATSG
jgi:hypothetical protein